MRDFELFEKIEAYLKQELNPEEMKAFELEIANNPHLAEQLELHRLEWDAMEVLIERDLRGKMSQWLKDPADAPPSVQADVPQLSVVKSALYRRIFPVWAAAAGVLVLVSMALWIFYRPQPHSPDMAKTGTLVNPETTSQTPKVLPSPDQNGQLQHPTGEQNKNGALTQSTEKNRGPKKEISDKPLNKEKPKSSVDIQTDIASAQDAYQKSDLPSYEDIADSRNASSETNTLDEAGKAYDQKNFEKAITLLKNTAVKDENFIALEILAHAYFQNKNYKAALPVFENLLNLSGRKSREKSEWYLLLCYLVNSPQHHKDFDILSQKILSNPQHFYFEATKSLRQQVMKH